MAIHICCNFIVEPISFSQVNMSHGGGPNTVDDMFLYASR